MGTAKRTGRVNWAAKRKWTRIIAIYLPRRPRGGCLNYSVARCYVDNLSLLGCLRHLRLNHSVCLPYGANNQDLECEGIIHRPRRACLQS